MFEIGSQYNQTQPEGVETMANGFAGTIEKLRAEIETGVASLKSNPEWAQVEKLYRALNTIEDLAEVPQTSLAAIFGFDGMTSNVSVRAGEFIGMEALDAAKAYLEKKKATAASIDEILDALQQGGANQIARDTLRMSLARSTWDVVKAPGQDLYQLVKYAPHVKRGGKKKLNTLNSSGVTEEALIEEIAATGKVPPEGNTIPTGG